MDPVTLGILVNAGGLLAKNFMGADRPDYKIPESARRALAQARILEADKTAPGEQKALDQVGISSANAVRAAQEGGNVLESISAIQGQQDRGTQGVLARSEADQRNDQERLMHQLGIMGQYEDMEYQMNEFAPYAERQQETRDIIGAMGTNAANLMQSQQLQEQLAGLTGVAPANSSSPKSPYSPNSLMGKALEISNEISEIKAGLNDDNRILSKSGTYRGNKTYFVNENGAVVYNKDGEIARGATRRLNRRIDKLNDPGPKAGGRFPTLDVSPEIMSLFSSGQLGQGQPMVPPSASADSPLLMGQSPQSLENPEPLNIDEETIRQLIELLKSAKPLF